MEDKKEQPEHSEIQRLTAEFVGTFLLTFVAAGADILDATTGGIGHVARYVAPALLVMGMIYAMSAVSGAHINPVVTLAFLTRRCFPPYRVPGYLISQVLGAIAAAATLKMLFGKALEHGITKPSFSFTNVQGLVMEVLLTFTLVYTILATSQEKGVVGKNSGLAVAGVIALCGLAFSPVSGSSMNPARSLGPMIVAGHLELSWIYVFGPLVGALLAVGVVGVIHGPPNADAKESAEGKTS